MVLDCITQARHWAWRLLCRILVLGLRCGMSCKRALSGNLRTSIFPIISGPHSWYDLHFSSPHTGHKRVVTGALSRDSPRSARPACPGHFGNAGKHQVGMDAIAAFVLLFPLQVILP